MFKIKQMIEKNNKANTKFCDLKEVYKLRLNDTLKAKTEDKIMLNIFFISMLLFWTNKVFKYKI